MSVFLGDGRGTFEALPVMPVRLTGLSMLVQDFSSDGALDIVVGGAGVDVFEGDGSGGFSSTPDIVQPSTSITSLAAADFNNDGRDEIAAAGHGTVIVLEGTVTVGFTVQGELAASDFGRGLLAEDFDNDGDVDLATLATSRRRIDVFNGDGNGTFATTASVPTAAAPYDLVTAHLDSDGYLDLITVSPPYTLDHEGQEAVSVALSDGMGGFRERMDYKVATTPHHVAACDVNGDETTDLVVSSNEGVVVLLGSPSGLLELHQVVPIRGMSWSLACADLDNDGFADVAVGELAASQVVMLFADGSGTLQQRHEVPVPELPLSLEVADVNDDGLQDLIVAGGPSFNLY